MEETTYPELTHETLLKLYGLGQLDKCFECWAATAGVGAGCQILEVDAFF